MTFLKSLKNGTKKLFSNYSEAAEKYCEAITLLYTIDTKK
jgi:hypothetical protein